MIKFSARVNTILSTIVSSIGDIHVNPDVSIRKVPGSLSSAVMRLNNSISPPNAAIVNPEMTNHLPTYDRFSMCIIITLSLIDSNP